MTPNLQPADADYDLAHRNYERLQFNNPRLVSDLAAELVFSHGSSLNLSHRYDALKSYIDPKVTTPRVSSGLEGRIVNRETPSLRDRVYPKKDYFPETGTPENRKLARILNDLASIGNTEGPNIERNGNLLQLPPDDNKSRALEHADRISKETTAQKQQMQTRMFWELNRALFSGNYAMMEHSTLTNLQWIEENLEGGEDFSREFTLMLEDLSIIGNQKNLGMTMQDALETTKHLKEKQNTPELNADV